MGEESSVGPRFPWWLTVGSGVLAIVFLVMHTRVPIVDRPLFEIGPVPVTTYGIVISVCTAIVFVTIKNFVVAFDSFMNTSLFLVGVKFVLLFLGALAVFQFLLALLGYHFDITGTAIDIGANGVRSQPGESP